MTDHEQHERYIAAARASWVAAHTLELPVQDPELAIDYDQAKHLDRIERSLADSERARLREESATRELRVAVVKYGRTITLLMRSVIGLFVLAVVLAVVFYGRLSDIAHRNTEAVRVSCTLLTNALLESGAGGGGQVPASPAATAQRQITATLVGAINRELLTAGERAAGSSRALAASCRSLTATRSRCIPSASASCSSQPRATRHAVRRRGHDPTWPRAVRPRLHRLSHGVRRRRPTAR